MVLPSFASGPSAVLNMLPIGEMILPIPLNPAVIIFPIFPSGDLAITPPSPDRIPDSLPPIAENGFRIPDTIFEPTPERLPPIFPPIPANGCINAEPTPPSAPFTFPKYDSIPLPAFCSFPARFVPSIPAINDLLLNRFSAICTSLIPFENSRYPSFPTSAATLSAASAATTFVIVCTSFGFACANSVTFCTTTATLSASVPTIGKKACPITIPKLLILFLAFSILAFVDASIFANASSVAFALSIIPCT